MTTKYDIQGKPIKVGYLIGFPTGADRMAKGRVAQLHPVMVETTRGRFRRPENCVVLEEPVWPRSKTP